MNFKTALFAATAPALMLAACEKAETTDAAGEEETSEATETEGQGEGEAGDEAKSEGEGEGKTDTAEDAKADGEQPITRLTGTYACEDQGDVEVTFREYSNGTATLTYENMSEMAANEEPTTTTLKAGPAGDPSGNPGKSGRLASADGTSGTNK